MLEFPGLGDCYQVSDAVPKGDGQGRVFAQPSDLVIIGAVLFWSKAYATVCYKEADSDTYRREHENESKF